MATRPPGTPQVALNGVSYATWLRRKRANPKMKDNTWQGYTTYVAQSRNEKAAMRASNAASQFGQSYFQIDPSRYARQVGSFLKQDPAYNPLSQQQMRQQATSMIMPMYNQQADQISQMIAQRGRQGMEAISGYTNAYLKTLPAVQSDIKGIYDEARALQGNSSAALGEFVKSSGANMAAEMAQMEQAAGQAPTGSQQVANTAAGSTAATGAFDWSTMSRLIGQGAGSQAWAASLPAIASAYGAQATKNFQGDLNSQLQDSLNQLQNQSQGDILAMYDSMLNRELAKAEGRGQRGQAMAGAYSDAIGMNQDARLAGAALNAQFGQNAQDYTQEYVAGMQPPVTKPIPQGYDAAGNPIIPKGTLIQRRWADVSKVISNAILGLIEPPRDPAGRPIGSGNRNFNQLMIRLVPMIRSQMGEFGLTEGQVRGFARQILAQQGIFPPVKIKKPKATGAAASPDSTIRAGHPTGYVAPKAPSRSPARAPQFPWGAILRGIGPFGR